MSLKSTIDGKIKDALRAHDETTKNLLRVALGEIQTQESRNGKEATDEEIYKILRKMVEGLKEIIKIKAPEGLPVRLPEHAELDILEALLPKQADKAAILELAKPVWVDILAAKSDGQATGVLMKALKTAGVSADGKLVGEVVKSIRTVVG